MVALVIVALVAGVVVALIAQSQGRDPVGWFIYGVLIWPVALIHVLISQPPNTGAASQASHSPSGSASQPGASQPEQSTLDQATMLVAAEWRAQGRAFDMLDAKEEARLRLMVRQPSSASDNP